MTRKQVIIPFWNISKREMLIQDRDLQNSQSTGFLQQAENPLQRMRSKIGCFYFADIHHDTNSKCNSPQDSFFIDDSEYSSNQVRQIWTSQTLRLKMQPKSTYIENWNGIWSSTVIFQSFVVEVDNDSTVSHQNDSEETTSKEGK